MKRPCVAVVDDEPSVRKGLSRLLRTAEFEARCYDSAQDFLDNWEREPPDCLILDLQMPGISGMEMQATLRRAGARMPVIVVTARDDSESQQQCLGLGAAAYLCKPSDCEALVEVVRAVLARS